MNPFKALKQGEKYSKKDLSTLLEQPTLSLVREGLYHCKNSESTLFFVDLEKKGKEERFHFDGFLRKISFIGIHKPLNISNHRKFRKSLMGIEFPTSL